MMGLGVSAIGQGLLYGLMGVGLFLTFRILDFPDMTVEGTFPLGAAVTVATISNGITPLLATLLGMLAGMAAGAITGFLTTVGKVPVLLAGILVMTGAYSVNLRIMGRANLSLLNKPNLFAAKFLKSLPPYFDSVVVGLIVALVVVTLLILFLNTQLGQGFIAAGDNPTMARSLGIAPARQEVLGLIVGNGLVALSGSLIAQNNGYADVNMGIGVIVIALASIIIGEVLFGELTLSQRLVATVLGSILYRFVLLLVLRLGFSPNDLQLISAIVLAILIMIPAFEHRFKIRRVLKNGVKTNG